MQTRVMYVPFSWMEYGNLKLRKLGRDGRTQCPFINRHDENCIIIKRKYLKDLLYLLSLVYNLHGEPDKTEARGYLSYNRRTNG